MLAASPLALRAETGAQGNAGLAEASARHPEQVMPAVVVGGRKPLYDVRDVNLGAFGAKDAFDIPLSIHSYSSVLMENQRARTLNDVVRNDPAVQNASIGGAFDHVSIRGFETDWVNTMRRDGLSIAPYQDVPLENVDRVDVLKGPSGFLYGYNSPGGTINHVLKRPTAKSFVSATGELRNHDGRYAHVDAGGKFGDESPLGYRVNAAVEKVGNFRHADDLSRRFLSAAIDWKLNRDALLRFDFDAQEKELAAQPLIGVQSDGRLPPAIDGRTLLGQPWLQYETRTHNVGARFDMGLGEGWSFTAQFNRSYNRRLAAFPSVYEVAGNGDIVSGDIFLSPDQTFRTTSGQAFVTGRFATGAVGHEIVTGISGRDYEARDAGYAILPHTVGNIFNPVYSPEPELPASRPKNLTENRQSSLFVSDLLSFGERWQAIVGARHIRYHNEFTRPGTPTEHYRKNSTVPSGGLIFRPTRRVMTYASYSEGLEQGGIAPFNSANAGEVMNPVKSEQLEAGIKAELLDELSFGAAVYEIEKGLQAINSDNVYVQDGRQRHRGLELTVGGQLTRDLALVAGLGFIDSEQVGNDDVRTRGKRTPNVPRRQASIFIDYRVPGIAGLYVNGGAYYVGARPLDGSNTVELPAYTRFDLGARYVTTIGGRKTTVRAHVDNLTDKRYWAAASFGSVYPGKPRTVSVSAQVEF